MATLLRVFFKERIIWSGMATKRKVQARPCMDTGRVSAGLCISTPHAPTALEDSPSLFSCCCATQGKKPSALAFPPFPHDGFFLTVAGTEP
jgi:hypothetical protein